MERKRWLQFIVSAVSLVFSLALDLYYPQVKDVLCTALPARGTSDSGSYSPSDRIEPSQHRLSRTYGENGAKAEFLPSA